MLKAKKFAHSLVGERGALGDTFAPAPEKGKFILYINVNKIHCIFM